MPVSCLINKDPLPFLTVLPCEERAGNERSGFGALLSMAVRVPFQCGKAASSSLRKAGWRAPGNGDFIRNRGWLGPPER